MSAPTRTPPDTLRRPYDGPLRTVWRAGYDAGKRGVNPRNAPFRAGSHKRAAWVAGHTAAVNATDGGES